MAKNHLTDRQLMRKLNQCLKRARAEYKHVADDAQMAHMRALDAGLWEMAKVYERLSMEHDEKERKKKQ